MNVATLPASTFSISNFVVNRSFIYWTAMGLGDRMSIGRTNLDGSNVIYKDVGNLYGCRNWVEYGLNQTKNELGWADFRLTKYQDIEKWWEIVGSTYLLVSFLPTCR